MPTSTEDEIIPAEINKNIAKSMSDIMAAPMMMEIAMAIMPTNAAINT